MNEQSGSFEILTPEAVKALPEFVAIDVEACSRLGMNHYLAGDLARAEECFLAVTRADPQHAFAWGNLGLIWQMTGHWDDALRCYQRSMTLDPNNAANITNLGYLTSEAGYPDNAIRLYERALELAPGQPRAEGNLGQALLRKFEFERAWPLLDARFRTVPRVTQMREYPGMSLWDGKPCRKLAVWPEQGVGDQILYSTLLPELVGRGQAFVCELDPRLVPAFYRSFPSEQFVPRGHTEGFAGCDAHVPMMSLGRFFRNSVESFVAQPHRLLRADPLACSNARYKLRPKGKSVAISWRSFHPAINIAKQTQKSAELIDFLAIGSGLRPDLHLVSVQYGDVEKEIEAAGLGVHADPDLDCFNNIEGVLARIDACDVVVTTSNVTAHFAGALGKETYLIYRRGNPPFFYWQPGTNGRSLWYPSVRIVSGEDMVTWADCIAKVGAMI